MAGVDISGATSKKAAAAAAIPESPTEFPKLFPLGSEALFRMEGSQKVALADTDQVTLVNVSLAAVNLSAPNTAIKPAKGVVEKRVRVLPFGRITLPAAYARRAFTCLEKPGAPKQLMVAPPNGDCGGQKFTDRISGREFSTCPYLSCKTCGAPPTAPLPCYWSVWQVQHAISQLYNPVAIQRIIETIDTRPAVMLWGLHVMSQRATAKALRTGRAGTVNLADPNVLF